MIRLNINGREVSGHKGQTILQIARENGIEIPTMCYDDRLEIYGACGLCVVEIKGSPKLARACATQAADGMVIDTMSERVIASRKVALELLMSDHVGDCRAPCMLACPGNTDCQGYVGLIANGMFEEAIKTIKDQLPMPACIGRVCPHPCETECRRRLVEEPIAIAQLKYFAADQDLWKENPYTPEIADDSGKKVAIVGGGPGGLSMAFFLRQYGHAITVYDAMPQMGGMLRYGIPEYRLPKTIVDREVEIIENMGVTMTNNVRMGQDISLETLRRENDAVVLATGAWRSSPLRCKGEEAEGVMGGIEFLEKVSLNQETGIGARVAVVGGGNTAMDAVRTAVRLGASEVYNIYRRTKQEMPAEEIEIIEAEEEGVVFKNLVNPIEIISENGKVKEILLQKMALGEPDASGRRRPIAIEGETETLPIDTVISAIGQKLDPAGHDDVALTDWGTIAADPHTFMTNLDGVFAIGDATNKGASIAIAAIGEAKRSSAVIQSYLSGVLQPHFEPFYSIDHSVTEQNFVNRERISRAKMPHLAPQARNHNFKEVNLGFSVETAMAEGARCLECGCLDVYECDLIKHSRTYKIKPEDIAGEKHYRKIERPHPFININQDKCILCSQCIRTCEEVLGIGALGLVDRGFDSMVSPAFDLPLTETGCISCGQCISVCPTGALQENLTMGVKSIPLPIESNETLCNKCGVGCHVDVNTKAGKIVRITSLRDSEIDHGQLCVRGRFGHRIAGAVELTEPLVKRAGEHVAVTWTEALQEIATALDKAADQPIAIAASADFCNEDYYSIKQLANHLGETTLLGSLSSRCSVLKDALGSHGSTSRFAELATTDHILMIGTDLMKDYAVIGMNIRQGLKAGTTLHVLDDRKTMAGEWAQREVIAADETAMLQLLKAVLSQTEKYDQISSSLQKTLQSVEPSDDIAALAAAYLAAKNAIILFDGSQLSDQSVAIIALLALASGHIDAPRNGIIELTRSANTRGLRDMGVCQQPLMADYLAERQVAALLSFGEVLDAKVVANANFTVAQNKYYQDWMKQVDVILPAPSFEALSGSFSNAEGRLQHLQAALPAADGRAVREVVAQLAEALAIKLPLSDIARSIANDVAGYQHLPQKKNCFITAPTEFKSLDDSLSYFEQNFSGAQFKFVGGRDSALIGILDDYLKEKDII